MQSASVNSRAPLLIADPVATFVVTMAGTIVCLVFTGASLGLFFGGITITAILGPPAVLLSDSWARRFIILSGLVDGVGIVWLVPMFQRNITLLQWLLAYVLLAAFALAVSGVACLLRSLRIPPLFSSAFTTVAAIAWLAWPIWLTPHIDSRPLVNLLIPPHPLFAMNGIMRHLGIWTEHPLMYRLTTLGQDIPYQLPSPLPAIAVHVVIAIATISTATWCDRVWVRRKTEE